MPLYSSRSVWLIKKSPEMKFYVKTSYRITNKHLYKSDFYHLFSSCQFHNATIRLTLENGVCRADQEEVLFVQGRSHYNWHRTGLTRETHKGRRKARDVVTTRMSGLMTGDRTLPRVFKRQNTSYRSRQARVVLYVCGVDGPQKLIHPINYTALL